MHQRVAVDAFERSAGHQGLRARHAEQRGRLDDQKRAKPFAAAQAGIADRRHEPARPVALALERRRAEEAVEQSLGVGRDLGETGQEILAAQWTTRFLVKGANATDITCRPQRLRCPASRNQRMASVSASVKGRAVKPRSRSALAAVKNIRYLDMRNASMVDLAAVERGQVPLRDVVDMDEVEAGVDEGGHAAARRLDDDASGRRRFDVARADRRRRIDDHGREALLGDHPLDQTLGRDLAALIGADRLELFEGHGLVDRCPVTLHRQGGDAAGIDDALDAGAQRLLHHDPGAGHVVDDDLVAVARPQPVVGGDVEQIAHARHRGPDGFGVAQIALHIVEVEARQVAARAGRPHQRAHRETALHQLGRHGRADEAAGAGDKHLVAASHEGCRNGMAPGLEFGRSSGR